MVRALALVRDLRIKAIRERVDPKAVRIALKYALLVDDAVMRLSPQEEEKLTKIAEKLFRETPQVKRLKLLEKRIEET